MDNKIKALFNETIHELSKKNKLNSDDPTYGYILKQLEFVYDCLISEKNILIELRGRELDFPGVASKNLAGSDDELLDKIGDISIYLSKL